MSGFTLVEMLVSTALVVLIMSLFAQIYSAAIGTITEQRAMGNNDQKARVLSKILHNDLKYGSYQQAQRSNDSTLAGIVPLTADDVSSVDQDRQRGYFYISENDPYNSSDDVLQFTIEIPNSDKTDPLVGNASEMKPSSGPFTAISYQPYRIENGPTEGTGQSHSAQISYFLRGGILYRRVLLLRELPFHQPPYPEQVSYNSTTPVFDSGREDYAPPVINSTNSFWKDFDYSATRMFYDPSDADSNGRTSYLRFLSNSSLTNDPSDPAAQMSLGKPWNRFGHLNDQRTSGFTTEHGMPREYMLSSSGDRYFIGRLTHLETSSSAMDFPAKETLASYNIFRRNDATITYDPSTTVVGGLTDGTRFGEDILLTNVESFDVQVWDPEAKDFVQIGLGTTFDNAAGSPGSASRINPAYGPSTTPIDNNIFDTWHPSVGASPPYYPIEKKNPGTWTANTSYGLNSVLRTAQSDGTPILQYHKYVYVPVALTGTPSGTGLSGTISPSFPPTLGNEVIDNEIVWRCVENRLGLQAIQIVIRYLDIQSSTPRQVTVIHSFVQ